jgi:hypothetical protein
MVKVVGEPCSPLPLLSPIQEKQGMVSPTEEEGSKGMVQYLPQSAELLVAALQRSENISRIEAPDDDILILMKIGRVLRYEDGDITISSSPTPNMTLTTKEMDINERMADMLLESIISMDDNEMQSLTTKEMDINERMADVLLKSIISMDDNDMQSNINSFIDYDHDDDDGHMTHNSIANLQRDLENAVHCFNEYDDDDGTAIEDDSRLLHRLKHIMGQKTLKAYSSYGAIYTVATIINIIGTSLGIGYAFNSAVARFCARIVVVSIMMRSKRVKLG